MKRSIVMSALIFLSTPLAAAAPEFGDARLQRLDDPLRTTFLGDPAKLTKQQIKEAIGSAALAKGWKVTNESDGRVELTATMNGKHVMNVLVTYDSAGYEIHYLSSTNLLYKETRDRNRPVQVIHKNYNVWIRRLADAVNGQVAAPVKVAVAGTAAPVRVKLTHNRVVPPASDFAAIDNVDAVPVREAGKDRYRHFLSVMAPKAFVVTENGGWRMFFKNPDAMAMALDHCEQMKIGCWLYAVDDKVVWNPDPAKRISRVDQLSKVAP
jgi:hypothetical protein